MLASLSLCLCSALSKVMFVQDLRKQAGAQISATLQHALSFHHHREAICVTIVQGDNDQQRFVCRRVFRNMLLGS